MNSFTTFQTDVEALLALPANEQRNHLDAQFSPAPNGSVRVPLLLAWTSAAPTPDNDRSSLGPCPDTARVAMEFPSLS
jgi:hypothetical protein